jgi:hypothetical protein
MMPATQKRRKEGLKEVIKEYGLMDECSQTYPLLLPQNGTEIVAVSMKKKR